jgi:hypothetical protein
MIQYKLRPIVASNSKITMGLTIPDEVAVFFKNCFFTIEKSGTSILCLSGASIIPTKLEVENYNFEDCRI